MRFGYQTIVVIAAAVLASCARAHDHVVVLDVQGRSNLAPWIAADGDVVAAAWGAIEGSTADVFVAVSHDGGRTFRPPVRVNAIAGGARLGGEFPPRVVIARRPDAADPEIQVLWTAAGDAPAIRSARSRDGGRTFEAPITLQANGAAGDRGWPSLALDASGGAHAIWLDHRGLAAASHAGHRGPHDGVAMAQKSGLFYASLADGAPVERELARGVCYCCKTALAAGPGGELYAAWRHVYPGNLRDMAFAVSRDGGRTFSSPVRVSEDGWMIEGCPDDGPALAVDGEGVVHIVWSTMIDEAEGALFYATTRDGEGFTPRVRIPTLGSPRPAHPQIVAGRDGRVIVAWDEPGASGRVAAAREIVRDSRGEMQFGPAVTIAPDGPAQYPVLAATRDGVVAIWTTGGTPSSVRVRTLRE